MFDLDGAIAQWRKRLSWRDAFTDADLDEMESHLRDEVEALVALGQSEQTAFYQTLRTFGEDIKLSFRFNQANWEKVMRKRARYAPTLLGNYFKVAIRNLFKHKIYAVINIVGLALGLATCILLIRYIQDEFNVDACHTNRDRIYRVVRETTSGGMSNFRSSTSGALAQTLKRDFSEIEKSARVWPLSVNAKYQNKRFRLTACIADPEMFEIFDFPFVNGSPKTAFQNPIAIAITESTAKLLFGNEDPIGQTITVETQLVSGERTITAVLKDIPHNTTLHFDYVSTIVAPKAISGWEGWNKTAGWRPVHTYFLLRKNAHQKTLEAKLPAFIKQYMGADIQASNAYHLQPINRIHLYSSQDYNLRSFAGGDINSVYQFAAIAFFVLAIGCINFANLTTARSVKRAREIGMRKVSGAHRLQIAAQFLGESILTTGLALLVALSIVQIVLPEFNTFFYKQLELNIFADPLLGLSLLATTVGVGMIAGLYPALFLSSIEPTQILKGTPYKGSRGQWIRKGLLLVQFAISVVLMVGTSVVYQQLDFIQNKPLGYNTDQMIEMPIFGTDQATKGLHEIRLADRYQTIKQAFLAHPNVVEATAYRQSLGWGGGFMRTVRPQDQEHTKWRMPILEVDEDYLNVFQIDILEGRNFAPLTFPADTSNAFIVNEAAVRALGWEDPIGKSFIWANWGGKDRSGKVVGVVKDFHYSSLHKKIAPVALACRARQFYRLGVRVKSENIDETLAFFEKTWKQFVPPNQPFRYEFWDKRFRYMYGKEQRAQTLTFVSSGLAILLACMGLFGLVSFAADERRKEIGIRKVFGASIPNVVTLLSRNFATLVVLANLIAWPIAYWMMEDWLQQFAYRITLSIWPFLISGLLVLLIASLTVGWQSIKAACANPVDTLYHE